MQRIVAIILLTLVLSVKAQNVSRIHQTLEMPQWSSQPIVLSNEIKGGIHTVATTNDMNNIPSERKQVGMLCVVGSISWNPATDKVYQYDGTSFKPISLLRVWETLGTYITGQIVVYNGMAYLSLTNHTGLITTPDTDTANWISLYQLSQSSHSPLTLGTTNGLSLSGQQLSLLPATTTTSGALTATDKTKLDALNTTTTTSGNILVANGSQWNSVAPTGDVTINSNGSTLIGNNTITSAKIANGTILPEDLATDGDYNVLRTDNNGVPQFGKILSSHISDGTITASDLSTMGANPGQVLKRNLTGASPNWIAADDNDSQTAAQVPVTPSGNLGSTNTQAALQELQSDIDGIKTVADGHIYVGNASNQLVAVAVSGEVTLSNAGVTTVADNKIDAANLMGATGSALGNGLSGQALTSNGAGKFNWTTLNSGSVTSVGIALPVTEFAVSGSPITTSGTLSGNWKTQTSNLVFASPSGSTGTPSFRSLTAMDIPSLDWTKISTGKPTTLSGYGITDGLSATLTNSKLLVGNGSNIASAVSLSGDATMNNAGVLTVANNAITTVKIADGAVTGAKIETGVSLNLTAALAANQSFVGNYEVAVVGESVVFGDVLYFDFSTLKWRKAKADNFSTTPVQRIALETIAANGSGKLLIEGFVRYDSWSFTAAPVYLSASASGSITSVQPSTTGNQIQRVGIAFGTNKLHFKPSLDVGEL